MDMAVGRIIPRFLPLYTVHLIDVKNGHAAFACPFF